MLIKRNVIKKTPLTMPTIRQRILFLFSFVIITCVLAFFYHLGISMVCDIFTGKDVVNYDGRNIFLLLALPVCVYFDVLVLMVVFVPLTTPIAHVYIKMMKIVTIYCIVVLVVSLPVSLMIHVYPLGAHYYSCGDGGPLSGMHYVKKKEMCQQFEYHPDSESGNQSSVILHNEGVK